MNEPELDPELHNELTAGEPELPARAPATAAAVAPGSTVQPGLSPARPLPFPAMPIGRTTQAGALAQLQRFGNRALAEVTYQLRRVGGANLAGCAAALIAAVIFVASNRPQGAAVAALKNDLARLNPPGNRAARPAPTGAMLAALPPRGEAPSVVGKVLEEAEAAGVELPRGQYEYVAARDGVAAHYRMTFPVHASYPKIREFIDRTLVALPAVAIEGMRLERKSVGDDSVDAEIKLAAFVRSDP